MTDKKNILVVGDIMVDEYVVVESSRRAPEADIPVWDEVSRFSRLGGAANVAANIARMGTGEVSVRLCGIGGGTDLNNMLWSACIDHDPLFYNYGGVTMVKKRFVTNDGKIFFRHDNFKKFNPVHVRIFRERFHAQRQLLEFDKLDMIVISDYDKGTITPEIMDSLSSVSREIMVVDSKREDLSIFSGARILKLNADEYTRQAGKYPNVESLFENVVVTRGADGAELRNKGPTLYSSSKFPSYSTIVEEFPVEQVKVVDVTGCGDTHTAAMALSLTRDKMDVRAAIRFANEMASKVVQTLGTDVPV